MNQSLLRRLTSRKLILALTPTILLLLKWAGTHVPPTPAEFYMAGGAIIAGIGGIAHVDNATIAAGTPPQMGVQKDESAPD